MIERIIERRNHDLGGGLQVGRVLPFHARRMVGPFIFFDHLMPVDLPAGLPQELDVRPHPHIGLSTVTYLYDGAITHRDSLGFEQDIRPGEVNWMVAGSGITHSERFDHARNHGAHMHGIQAWIALPEADEQYDPGFFHHAGDDLPIWEEPGISGRLIAGEFEGMKAGVKTHSPLFYVHLQLREGARRTIPTEYSERALYVASGLVELSGSTIETGQMAVLTPGEDAPIRASENSILMLLGGESLGELYLFWNFVSSSKERLEAAKQDWAAGRMKLPDGDDQEFIPLHEAK